MKPRYVTKSQAIDILLDKLEERRANLGIITQRPRQEMKEVFSKWNEENIVRVMNLISINNNDLDDYFDELYEQDCLERERYPEEEGSW